MGEILREQKKKYKKNCVLQIIFGLTILLFVFSLYSYLEQTSASHCFYENGILLRQYLSNTSCKNGGDCSDYCLFMDVITEDGLTHTYYFAKEHKLRDDLIEGNNISIKWCYINDKIGYRIRGVKKK